MSHLPVVDHCTCPNDCDGNSYAYSMSLKKLDSDAMCRSSFRLRSYLSSPEVSGYPKFMQNFDNMTRDYVYDLYGLCTKTLDELAFVQIQFASSNVLQFRTELRVTLADQVANLGGTLGLFTGMSILSFCEVLFWAARALGAALRYPSKKV